MILVNELKGKIVARGLTSEKVAEHLGISTKTFYNKLQRGVFGSDEIEKMMILLNIENPAEIFFAKQVTQ